MKKIIFKYPKGKILIHDTINSNYCGYNTSEYNIF